MADIGNIGHACRIKGKLSGNYYEGLLFDRMVEKGSSFEGRHYVIDVDEMSDDEVLTFHNIYSFNENEIPYSKLQGEKYLVVDGRPRFGVIGLVEDLKGEI